MTEQSEAGDVRRRANQAAVGEICADNINARHQRDRFLFERSRNRASLDRGRDDSGPERFGEQKQIARSRIGICHDVSKIDNPRDGEAVEWFRRADRVPTDDGAIDFACFGKAAAQNRGDGFSRYFFGWHANDVERGDRAPAHRENVGERVGRGNFAVLKWIIDNWRKEIHGLDKRAGAVEAIDSGVIGRS